MSRRRDRIRELLQRHGATPDPVLVDALAALPRAGEGATVAGSGRDTWYADAPTEEAGHARVAEEPARIAGRYELLDLLGRGGMGEVHRARDHRLGRLVALKIATRFGTPAQRSRFLHEAQTTAQLDHPGIVPIYDYGELDDGALYYTMPVVRGRTLGQVLREVHRASEGDRWEPAPDGTTFRRLIASFLAVCEAMAYAHDRGVIHRDLKPENVMLGRYGQTVVVDWGLARILGTPSLDPDPDEDDAVRTERSSSAGTQWGAVTGTPQYMPPEQARGELDQLGPWSDAWSLGAILYEILTGRPPYVGRSKVLVVAQVISTPPDPVRTHARLPVPDELAALADRCLEPDLDRRPDSARVLVEEVRSWLDGQRARERALDLVRQADALVDPVAEARARADQREREARRLLAAVESWRPVEDKLPGWRLEDEAWSLRAEADRVEQQRLQRLREALNLVPDLDEANARLAAHYRALHEAAEQAGDRRRMAEAEALLRAHDTGAHARYLRGTGSLVLHTSPAGAEVSIHPYELRERRLVQGDEVWADTAPLVDLELPAGSYVAVLRAPGRAVVRWPFRIRRGQRTAAIPPGADAPRPVVLPPVDALAPDECLVPAGWFTFGDPEAYGGIAQVELWVDAFVAQRTPVTVGAFLEFLAALRADGDPRFEVFRPTPEQMALRDGPDGSLLPGPDAEGFDWEAAMPMSYVSYSAAVAYAAWRAARDGKPWRLPTEVEWEKAARGVDGRIYPWGAFLDPTWCAVNGSAPGAPAPRPVGSHPVDRGPYGLQDACGAVTEWTSTLYRMDGPTIVDQREAPDDPEPLGGDTCRVGRGAAFYYGPAMARLGTRFMVSEVLRDPSSGFRLVRSVNLEP